mmetsp:Transcript_113062/g.196082  ORF Transcript_113062/g.196082 Transcript_113062/m.196082 type:complete len:215 (-) Transcript_113062:999-1643(-)
MIALQVLGHWSHTRALSRLLRLFFLAYLLKSTCVPIRLLDVFFQDCFPDDTTQHLAINVRPEPLAIDVITPRCLPAGYSLNQGTTIREAVRPLDLTLSIGQSTSYYSTAVVVQRGCEYLSSTHTPLVHPNLHRNAFRELTDCRLARIELLISGFRISPSYHKRAIEEESRNADCTVKLTTTVATQIKYQTRCTLRFKLGHSLAYPAPGWSIELS